MSICRYRLLGALSLAVITSLASAEPNTQVLQAAKAEQDAYQKTLETLVNIDSGTGDTEGLGQIKNILVNRLQSYGAQVDTYPAKPLGGDVIVGRMEGQGEQHLMLMIHYDTVFNVGTAEKRPFEINDHNMAHGPGVADAKGGVSMILHTLAILKKLGYNQYGTLTIVFNPDEEKGSTGSRQLIRKLASKQDDVLVYEPSFSDDGVDAVTVQTKGINYPKLEVKGRASHAGAAPEKGRNAVIELSHQLLQLNDLGDPSKKTTLNWTVVSGGTKHNVIPAHAEAHGDMRYFDASEYDRVKHDAEKIIKNKKIPDTTVAFSLTKGRPPMPDNSQTDALAKTAQDIYAELGRDLKMAKIGGGTDAGYAYTPGNKKPAVLESMGIVGGGYHSQNEFADLGSVVPRLYLSARMVMALSQPDE